MCRLLSRDSSFPSLTDRFSTAFVFSDLFSNLVLLNIARGCFRFFKKYDRHMRFGDVADAGSGVAVQSSIKGSGNATRASTLTERDARFRFQPCSNEAPGKPAQSPAIPKHFCPGCGTGRFQRFSGRAALLPCRCHGFAARCGFGAGVRWLSHPSSGPPAR